MNMTLPYMTPNQEWAASRGYQAGVNLGGWLDMEPWMFDVPLYASAGAEQDVISRLRKETNDSHTLATMRNHWGGFVDDTILHTLADFGITHVRIPVGYWILDAPVSGVEGSSARTMYQYGFQTEGFATGGMNYLERLLKKLP